jgi:hypothetical protein
VNQAIANQAIRLSPFGRLYGYIPTPALIVPHWLSGYLAITAVGGTLLYFLRIRFMPLLNQVLTLSIACIYLTAFSGDGTLIHLYYPLGMLFLLSLRAWRDGVAIQGLSTLMYSMAFCVSMESFLVLPNPSGQGFRLIGPAHAIGLGIMLVAALRYPMGPPLADDLGETVLSQPVTDWARRTATD